MSSDANRRLYLQLLLPTVQQQTCKNKHCILHEPCLHRARKAAEAQIREITSLLCSFTIPPALFFYGNPMQPGRLQKLKAGVQQCSNDAHDTPPSQVKNFDVAVKQGGVGKSLKHLPLSTCNQKGKL